MTPLEHLQMFAKSSWRCETNSLYFEQIGNTIAQQLLFRKHPPAKEPL